MGDRENTKAAHEFATNFANALAASIALGIGEPWPLEVPAFPDSPLDHGTPIHFRLKIDGELRGECFIEFFEPQVSLLVGKMPRQSEDSASAEQQEEQLAKVVSAAIPVFVESLSTSYGETTVKVDRVAGLAFGGMFVVPLVATADPSATPILLYFDAHLLDALAKSVQARHQDDSDDRQVNPHNLKLVMDVELNVSLLFGRRQLPLRDVLDLSNGSVVELDRMVDDPVELLLDGKVIARGEAVIVDGNYGLRVTEIPQPIASHFSN